MAQDLTPTDYDRMRAKLLGLPLPSLSSPQGIEDLVPLPESRMSVQDISNPSAQAVPQTASLPMATTPMSIDQMKTTNAALQGAAGKNQAPIVKQDSKTTTDEKRVSPSFLRPNEAQELGGTIDFLKQQYAKGVADQEEGVKQQLRDLGLLARVPPKVDLTPGYYLANALSDKNNRQEIPKQSPNEAQASVEDLLNLENKIQSQRGGVSKAETALIRAPMGGLNVQDLRTVLTNMLGIVPQRPVVPPTSSALSKDADSFVKEAQGPTEAVAAAQRARTELAQNTGPATNALRVALTGLAGMRSGRMPLAEIQGFGGDPAVINKGEQIIGKLTEGTPLTPLDRQQIGAYIEAVDLLSRKKVQDMAAGHAATFNKLHPGQTAPADYSDILIKRNGGLAPPVSGPSLPFTPDAIDAEIKRRQGKK